MDYANFDEQKRTHSFRRKEWRFVNDLPLIFIYLLLFFWQVQSAQSNLDTEDTTKIINNINSSILNNDDCHNCPPNSLSKHTNNNENNINNNLIHDDDDADENDSKNETILDEVLTSIEIFTEKIIAKSNKTEEELEKELLESIDESLKTDNYKIVDGIEIQPTKEFSAARKLSDIDVSFNATNRAIFSRFGFERKLFNRVRTFFETHVLSISLPKAARLFGFRSFGLKKLLIPILFGAQILKSVLVAMFLPSILGSFGKIIGKGLSHLSASSSQASYPPVVEEPDPYAGDEAPTKDITGYETDPQGVYAYPQDHQMSMFTTANDVNSLADGTMSRYGPGGAKVTYLPSKDNDYYKNQVASNNYKVFHKIPASSMILSNYDPFYSPLLSRLDGIFARLGLAPPETGEAAQQPVSSIKLEACREQLICLMYSSPAKYAPYSNLVSAQLSRELNELRRPTSDNAEILRFFRYMRAARQGQEGADCVRAHAACAAPAEPAHTMIAAYHDINKLVSARRLQ